MITLNSAHDITFSHYCVLLKESDIVLWLMMIPSWHLNDLKPWLWDTMRWWRLFLCMQGHLSTSPLSKKGWMSDQVPKTLRSMPSFFQSCKNPNLDVWSSTQNIKEISFSQSCKNPNLDVWSRTQNTGMYSIAFPILRQTRSTWDRGRCHNLRSTPTSPPLPQWLCEQTMSQVSPDKRGKSFWETILPVHVLD